MYPLLCAGVCTCAYPCVWQWVYTWLQACAHWTATCLNVLKGTDECCKSNRVLYLKKERRRTTHIWDDSVRFSPTPSQFTRALLISGWACSCVGRNHMGEIKLSPIWGYVLNSSLQAWLSGKGGGRVRQGWVWWCPQVLGRKQLPNNNLNLYWLRSKGSIRSVLRQYRLEELDWLLLYKRLSLTGRWIKVNPSCKHSLALLFPLKLYSPSVGQTTCSQRMRYHNVVMLQSQENSEWQHAPCRSMWQVAF